ncbi:MAG TPA: hypothetical protein VJQ49_05260 [Casimicrobiaceae bacterium]|nr:hypothetical protein [Casimicrobiaceae bacterium]
MNTMLRHSLALAALAVFVCCTLGPRPALAHGIAGKRFFPATLATDDPFVADELSLPTIASRRTPGAGEEPAARESEFAIDVSKRVTDNLGIGLGASYKVIQPDGGSSQRGFDNLAANIKYKFYQSDEHETILSAGVDWDIGGSGSKRVGAESFSTVTPALFFGKGFGDLPESMKFARPVAVTGLVGLGIPTRSATTSINDQGEVSVERHPHTLAWGFAVEYSLPYLQSFVQDVGLREPFNRMIPLVEFAMSTALDRGASGTTGTVNPGVIWAGRYAQVAVEAVVPVNNRSGTRVGWIAQLHFFLDDLFPKTLGRPIFRP